MPAIPGHRQVLIRLQCLHEEAGASVKLPEGRADRSVDGAGAADAGKEGKVRAGSAVEASEDEEQGHGPFLRGEEGLSSEELRGGGLSAGRSCTVPKAVAVFVPGGGCRMRPTFLPAARSSTV